MKKNIFSLSAVLGILFFSLPTLAMECEPQCDSQGESQKKSFSLSPFDYDFQKLEEAQEVIEKSKFLLPRACEFFKDSVRNYDRSQFLRLLNSESERDDFLSTADPQISRFLSLNPMLWEELKRRYMPCINNIRYDIEKNGIFNTELFDSFFYHILGIGSIGDDQTQYNQEDVENLFINLKNIGFIKNIKNKLYNPINIFEDIFKKRPNISTLIIAEGHRGRPNITSISSYKKEDTLTIDLSPFQAPDVIGDITELSEKLIPYYKGRLNAIYDTSLMDGSLITTGETAKYLVDLLRPGGRLTCLNFGEQYMAKDKIKYFEEAHGLKALYTEELYTEELEKRFIALEKP